MRWVRFISLRLQIILLVLSFTLALARAMPTALTWLWTTWLKNNLSGAVWLRRWR